MRVLLIILLNAVFAFSQGLSVRILDTRSLFQDDYRSSISSRQGYDYLETTAGEASTYFSSDLLTYGSGDISIYMRNFRVTGSVSDTVRVYIDIFRGIGYTDRTGYERHTLTSFVSSDSSNFVLNDKPWVAKEPFNKFRVVVKELTSQQNQLLFYVSHARKE